MNMRTISVLAAVLMAVCVSAWSESTVPSIVRENGQFRLMVDGAPYLVLGGQSHNSTPSDPARLHTFFQGVKALGGNTAEVPVFWETIEATPGAYDFAMLDNILSEARVADVRVVLLWFATWKNGESHYTPEWVKWDTKTYPRVRDAWGKETDILSPLCAAAREADARAFGALLAYLKKVDSERHTVIMVQVENEPGFLGTDRDYGAEATALFQAQVPQALTEYLDGHAESLSDSMKAVWKLGARGDWASLFGPQAEETFTAWHVARYLESVAQAGKTVYPLPLYSNAWLVEPGGERAGKWPSGGGTEHVIDVWKAAAPSLDIIAPDIYFPKYRYYARQYARVDNPLFVPEVNGNPFFAAYPFQTFAEFNALGFCVFGMDNAATDKSYDDFKVTYGVLRPLLPLIARYQYTGKMRSFIQGISEGEDWAYTLPAAPGVAAVVTFTHEFNPTQARGRGLMFELEPDTFLFAGSNFTVNFRTTKGKPCEVQILSIEEGGPDAQGQWQTTYRRNGDERSVSLPVEGGLQRVKIRLPE